MACEWGRPWVLCAQLHVVHAMGARGGRRRTCWVVMRVGGFMGHFIGMVEAYAGCFEGSMGFLAPPERAFSRSRLFFISTARRTDISFAAFIFASSFSCTAETIGAVDGRPSWPSGGTAASRGGTDFGAYLSFVSERRDEPPVDTKSERRRQRLDNASRCREVARVAQASSACIAPGLSSASECASFIILSQTSIELNDVGLVKGTAGTLSYSLLVVRRQNCAQSSAALGPT